MNSISLVEEFHKKFGHKVINNPDITDKKLNKARVNFIREEVRELKEALDKGDLVGVFDALLDLQYFIDGSFLSFGFHRFKTHGMIEVHKTNMDKLWPDGTIRRKKNGKIIKPPGWKAPDLLKVLQSFYK